MRILIVVSLFLGTFLQSCQSQTASGTVDAKTFQQKLNETKDKVILDVRTPEEYAEGYIDQAVLMNYYDDSFESGLKKLDKNKTYFVYCAAGGRSHSALEDMQKAGFTKVIELGGGITAWKANKLPLVKPK
jgi:rhodanese-related sulfurtransferase